MRLPKSLGNPHKDDRRDFLNEYSRLSVAFLLIVAAVILVASLSSSSSSKDLPGIAFGWVFGLAVIRAAVVFGVVALVAMVLIRGWGGLWPQGVSTSGFEYNPTDVARNNVRVVELQVQLEDELRSLKSKIAALEELGRDDREEL
jgi:hypothetical protein